jgi:hypothetical protein
MLIWNFANRMASALVLRRRSLSSEAMIAFPCWRGMFLLGQKPPLRMLCVFVLNKLFD